MPSRYTLTSLVSTLLLALALVTQVHAQGQVSFQYFYDELGQLVKVVDLTGVVIEYVYDKVGNILEIKRTSVPPGPVIFNFTPSRGPVTTKVTIQGQGFSTNQLDNTVRFNGTSAEVLSATATTLVVTVPTGATTGKISVQVGANTAMSGQDFTVTNAPVITDVLPAIAFPGVTIPNFLVKGINLTGSTFSVLPLSVPPLITVEPVSIDPSGASATVRITISANARDPFFLFATNIDGSSDSNPSSSNTVTILNQSPIADPDHDGLSNLDELVHKTDPFDSDTDNDGFSDGNEVEGNSNPLDPTSHPFDPEQRPPGDAISPVFSVKNITDPGQGLPVPPGDAISPVFSIKNTTNPGAGQPVPPGDAISPVFSIKNEATP
jgi:YD repeat-containing protein